MDFVANFNSKLYTKNDKKYIDIKIPPEQMNTIHSIHQSYGSRLTKPNVQLPLNGDVLTIKVPYRNNRISCRVRGVKTLYEVEVGDKVNVVIENCGVWTYGDFCGIAWKLSQAEISS